MAVLFRAQEKLWFDRGVVIILIYMERMTKGKVMSEIVTINCEVRKHGYRGVNKNNVSQVSAVFYFIDFLDRLLYVDLRKGLEVCGILSDVYISRFRNVRGQHFGFAKYFKVCDVKKLKKHLIMYSFGISGCLQMWPSLIGLLSQMVVVMVE